MRLSPIVLLVVAGFGNAALAADYKPEFRMSVVANEDTAWGRAANRFANAVRFRTKGRINIKGTSNNDDFVVGSPAAVA